ncbi:MAG: HEAT repeat domain-containing protein [Ignavibacteriaceae bacterium]|nr:HEAT repeat domain-containing protein [Ignavibacteriaceae bacterium]
MNKYLSILVLFFMMTAATAFANVPVKVKTVSSQTIESLMTGLESDNYGLKMSSAYMLGELSSEEAMFSLMHMLRTSTNEEGRIVAALALYKISSPVGMNIVKKAVKFDGSERVKKLCNSFYNQYVKDNRVNDGKIFCTKN